MVAVDLDLPDTMIITRPLSSCISLTSSIRETNLTPGEEQKGSIPSDASRIIEAP